MKDNIIKNCFGCMTIVLKVFKIQYPAEKNYYVMIQL